MSLNPSHERTPLLGRYWQATMLASLGVPDQDWSVRDMRLRHGWGWRLAGVGCGQAPEDRQVVQVAPLRVKLVGVASLVFQVPWKPSEVLAPGAMVPL